MKAIFSPSEIKGAIAAPPNKSLTHRYLICAALAEGKSTIRNILLSDDTNSTLGAITELGANVEVQGKTAYITGTGGIIARKDRVIDCNESGSTLRLLLPAFLLCGGKTTFCCSKRLIQRVDESIEWIFNRDIEIGANEFSIIVKGMLKDGAYEIRSFSSQFISGLMMALALKEETSAIHYTNFPAKQYITMTDVAMHTFGVTTRRLNERMILVGGPSDIFGRYKAREYTINECDWSNAAMLIALGAQVTNFVDTHLIADAGVQNYLDELKNTTMPTIDVTECPDLAPTLFAYAAANNGGIFKGCKKLEYKESDRRMCMKKELEKFGSTVAVMGDGDILAIGPATGEPNEEIDGHNDHRIVMAMSILAVKYGGVIRGAECVNKSYPNFFNDIKDLNAKVLLE